MARPLRIEFLGAVYHLTARGNARQNIYLHDTDRSTFLDFLEREVLQQRWRCYAYCLMSNHYHLLIETPEGNLVQGMRRLNGTYSQAFNRRYGRVGHVFQGRYTSIIVDRETYMLPLCRYIVLNPVRAHLVEAIHLWPWSSYAATAGLTSPPVWLDTTGVLQHFGPTREHALVAYRHYVAAGTDTSSPWEQLRGQMWLGDEAFRTRMEHLAQNQSWADVPSAHTHPLRPTQDEVLQKVGAAYDIATAHVLDRSRQRPFQAAVYLLRRAANVSLKDVASLAGVSPSRVSHIQRRIEQGEADEPLRQLLLLYKVKN